MIKRIWIGVLLFGVTFQLSAQEKSDKSDTSFVKRIVLKHKAKRIAKAERFDNYAVFGPTTGSVTTQDTRMSPNIYSGSFFGGKIGLIETSEKWFSYFNGEFSTASLSAKNHDLTSGYSFNYAVWEYGVLRKTGLLKNQIAIGAKLDGFVALRLHSGIGNSSFNIDVPFGISPMVRWQHNSNILKRPVWLYGQFSFNAFSGIYRAPTFNINLNDGAFATAYPTRFNHLRIDLGMVPRFKWSNENRMGIHYSLDMYQLHEDEGYYQITNVQHLFSFTYWLKFR
ncbi:MAG: hypothetical protein KDC92_12180 [Bacteroidetes bacterium]|nr:hypothetical protein [Bacteroidota bacterium]